LCPWGPRIPDEVTDGEDAHVPVQRREDADRDERGGHHDPGPAGLAEIQFRSRRPAGSAMSKKITVTIRMFPIDCRLKAGAP
jgi:hypothetical protein